MGQVYRFVIVEMLKPCVTNYHDTCRDEIDQSHTIRGRVFLQAELSDSDDKDTFSADLCFEIREDDFGIMELIVYLLELYRIVIICPQGVGANESAIIEFSYDTYCGYSMIDGS